MTASLFQVQSAAAETELVLSRVISDEMYEFIRKADTQTMEFIIDDAMEQKKLTRNDAIAVVRRRDLGTAKFDIDGDGTPELITTIMHGVNCGSVGCGGDIYERIKGDWVLLSKALDVHYFKKFTGGGYQIVAFISDHRWLYYPPKHRKFKALLKKRDAIQDNIGGINRDGIYLGRYRLGLKALQNAKFINEHDQWTGRFGVTNEQEFVESPKAQAHAMEEYSLKNDAIMKTYKLYQFIGRFVESVRGRIQVTEGGLFAAAHRHGAKRVKEYFDHQVRNNWQSAFSNLEKQYQIIFGRIEKRLRDFQNTPARK